MGKPATKQKVDLMTTVKVQTKEGETKEIDLNLLKTLVQIYKKFPNDFWATKQMDNLVSQSRNEILSGTEKAEKFDLNYLNAVSGIRGMRAQPINANAGNVEDVFLGYPSLPPYAFAVEWELRAMRDGHVDLDLDKVKDKIQKRIASLVDPDELGRIYEDGFAVCLERYQSLFGESPQLLKRMDSVSERRREFGRMINEKLFLFTDPRDIQILEIRSPPCGDPQTLERFLGIAKEAVAEVHETTDTTFVPFGVVDNDTMFSANVNVHVKIPTPEDLTLLGYSVSPCQYNEVPLIMANAVRNHYAVLSSHSRNSIRPSSKIWWLEKFMQIIEHQRHADSKNLRKDFMVGDRFSWENYSRSMSHLFRPNIGVRSEYWTIEVGLDGQGSVPEILSDAQMIAGVAYKQLETLSGKRSVERDYLSDEIERIILNEEMARTVLQRKPMALLPSLSGTSDFSNVLSYALNRDLPAALCSMVESGLLKEVPMSKVRSDIAQYAIDIWKPQPTVSDLMTAERPESGSYRQRVESEDHGYSEMILKSTEHLYKDRKWRA